MKRGPFLGFAAIVVILCWGPASPSAHAQEQDDEHATFNVHEMIEVLGISTLSLLVATALAGLLMKRNRKVLFRVHKILAVLTIISAVSHASLVLLF